MAKVGTVSSHLRGEEKEGSECERGLRMKKKEGSECEARAGLRRLGSSPATCEEKALQMSARRKGFTYAEKGLKMCRKRAENMGRGGVPQPLALGAVPAEIVACRLVGDRHLGGVIKFSWEP